MGDEILGYMRLKKLKNIFTTEEDMTDEQNETAPAELIRFLDERSLTLVIREDKDKRSPSMEDIERTLYQW